MAEEAKVSEAPSTASSFLDSRLGSEPCDGKANDASSTDTKFGLESTAARKAVSTSVPPRIRSRRKRVALALKDWERVPSYLRDNE